MKHISKTMTIVLALTCICAWATDEVKVTAGSPRKDYFPANGQIKLLDKQGTLSFVNARDGQTYTFRRNQIIAIETDMPKDVLALENIFRSLDYQKVIDLTEQVSQQSVWTGWGAYVSFLKAMAEVNLAKYDDASSTLKSAAALYASADQQETLIKTGLMAVSYAQNGGNIEEKPSSYWMLLNGLAYEKKNELREAALEYMKAMELYPAVDKNGVPNLERVAAMARLVGVLKANKDMGTAASISAELAAGK